MMDARAVDIGACTFQTMNGIFSTENRVKQQDRGFSRFGKSEDVLSLEIMAGTRVKQSTALASCVVFLAVLLSGCAVFPGGGPAPLDTFELSAPAMELRGRPRTQILIAESSALKALDGQNIVVRPSPNAIEYLKGAQWADRLPKLVQARLVETFQRSGAFGGVGKPGEGLAIDYQLLVEIRKFEIRTGASSVAEVEFFVRILNDRNGVIRASRTFAGSAPVSGAGNAAYIAALDRAFGEAASQIAVWSAGLM